MAWHPLKRAMMVKDMTPSTDRKVDTGDVILSRYKITAVFFIATVIL